MAAFHLPTPTNVTLTLKITKIQCQWTTHSSFWVLVRMVLLRQLEVGFSDLGLIVSVTESKLVTKARAPHSRCSSHYHYEGNLSGSFTSQRQKRSWWSHGKGPTTENWSVHISKYCKTPALCFIGTYKNWNSCCYGVGAAMGKSNGLTIEKSWVWVPAGAFSSPGSTFRAFISVFVPPRLTAVVRKRSQSLCPQNTDGWLQLNTHASCVWGFK